MSKLTQRFSFFKSTFYKLLGWNSISIVFKIAMGLVSSKLVSIYLGLQGINTLENFRNFTHVGDAFSQAGIQNGIVKSFAISENDIQDRKVFSTAFLILILITTFTGICLIIIKPFIESYLFGGNLFSTAILLYAFCLPTLSVQTVIMNYFQGKQFFKKVILINCLGYIINIILSVYLITTYQLAGAVYQIIIAPLILTFITFLIFSKEQNISRLISFSAFDRTTATILFRFSLMTLVSSILAPVSFLTIRNMIENQLGTETGGIWSAILRLSGFYMMFVSSICSLYFFPKLAREESEYGQRLIIKEYIKKFLPVIFIGLLFCYIFQNVIFLVIYTEEFLVLKKYFYLQLIADFIKSFALIFGYVLLANQNIKRFIAFEFISVGISVVGAYLLIHGFGLSGVYYALILSLIIYAIILIVDYYRKEKI